jgi:hypothetical protein
MSSKHILQLGVKNIYILLNYQGLLFNFEK